MESRDGHHEAIFPLNLLPENPSQSPPVDSGSGLGVYTGNSDGSPPSSAVLLVLSDLEMVGGGSRVGDSWSIVGWYRTAGASCACMAGAAVGVLVDDADAGAGVAGVRAAAYETCSVERKRERSAKRSEAQTRGRALGPFGHFAESRIRGSGSLSSNSTAVAIRGTVLAHWVSRPSPGGDVDTSAPNLRLQRTVESKSPEGENELGA